MTTLRETPGLRRRVAGILVVCGAVGGITAIGDSGTALADSASDRPAHVTGAPPFAPLPGPDTPVAVTPPPEPPEPSPFDEDTCLNGKLPDSTVSTEVHDIAEVPCSAPDAHYRVIQRFHRTTDMDLCKANPRNEYSFSHSYTRNGVPVTDMEYVYCLVGLGSYARPAS
ncbi:hypothetical protein [Streptomyces sp. NBC_00158]|uniref:LppU/SCO3897 family protein n=1 Tax=Streptomyces sp. NBC_00158 TaxID=2903627 RepID=UPI003254EB40